MLEYKFNKEIKIGLRKIKNLNKPFVISEIGNNHNQNFAYLKKMVDYSVKNKCEAVKFQLYKAEDLVSKNDRNYNIFKANELRFDSVLIIANNKPDGILYRLSFCSIISRISSLVAACDTS